MEVDFDPRTGSSSGRVEVLPEGKSDEQVAVLPRVLDLVEARKLRDRTAAMLSDGAMDLDARDVEIMSTPCVQVLLAAARTAFAAGASFTIHNASDPFRAALAELGLQPEFSKWML